MKRRLKHIVILSTSLWMAGFGGSLSAEMGHDILVRNALDRPVLLAITNGPLNQPIGESTVRARWELTLKNVKAKDRANSLDLGVQVRNANDTLASSEITHCQTTLTKTSVDPRIAVIIHASPEANHPRCDIIDLNAFQAVAAVPQVPERSLALKN